MRELLKKYLATGDKFLRNILRERVLGVHPKYRNARSQTRISAEEWEKRVKDFERDPKVYMEHNGIIPAPVERI